MLFEKMAVDAFLDELASDSPAPGGGSVAALCASLGGALVSMVANLTIGKEKYKDNWAEMEKVLAASEALRAKFIDLMNKDTESFNIFMKAMKMPRTTEEEKAVRKEAMSEASKAATEIPLLTVEACVELSELAFKAAKFGNTSAVSDGGCAALMAEAAGKSAAYNVRINLPGVTDEAFKVNCRTRMRNALDTIHRNAVRASDIMDKSFP